MPARSRPAVGAAPMPELAPGHTGAAAERLLVPMPAATAGAAALTLVPAREPSVEAVALLLVPMPVAMAGAAAPTLGRVLVPGDLEAARMPGRAQVRTAGPSVAVPTHEPGLEASGLAVPMPGRVPQPILLPFHFGRSHRGSAGTKALVTSNLPSPLKAAAGTIRSRRLSCFLESTIEDHVETLSGCFAVSVYGFAVMDMPSSQRRCLRAAINCTKRSSEARLRRDIQRGTREGVHILHRCEPWHGAGASQNITRTTIADTGLGLGIDLLRRAF